MSPKRTNFNHHYTIFALKLKNAKNVCMLHAKCQTHLFFFNRMGVSSNDSHSYVKNSDWLLFLYIISTGGLKRP